MYKSCVERMKLHVVFLLGFGSVVLTYVNGVMTRNCEADFHECSLVENIAMCQTKLGECIKSQHHNSDMIPKKKRDFMVRFKCCYQTLSLCIEEEKSKKKKKKDIDLRHCSEAMLKCAKGGRSLMQFVKESPAKLRAMFGKYGVCIRTQCLNGCVNEYYNNTEDLLGMDCLNKYVNCIYSSDDKEKRRTCHNGWKTCMVPECKDTGNAKFVTKLIKGIWNCKKDPSLRKRNDDYVLDSLKCILELYKDGISMSHWLTIEHVREACFIVYGEDNNILKLDYERCVENNSKSADSAQPGAKKRLLGSRFSTH